MFWTAWIYLQRKRGGSGDVIKTKLTVKLYEDNPYGRLAFGSDLLWV